MTNVASPSQYASVSIETTNAMVDTMIQKRLRYLDVDESDNAPVAGISSADPGWGRKTDQLLAALRDR